MRQIIGFLLFVVFLASATPARTRRDWEHVKKLKHGSLVEIWLWSGHIASGWIDVVSDTELRIAVMKTIDSGKLTFDRADIREIVLVHSPFMGRHYESFQDAMIVTAVLGTIGDVAEVAKNPNGPRVAGVVAVIAGVTLLSAWIAHTIKPRRSLIYEDALSREADSVGSLGGSLDDMYLTP